MVDLHDFLSGDNEDTGAIAVIGMACRYPGSDSVEAFWQNIALAKELISHFSEEQLRAAGVRSQFLDNPHYVRAKGIIEGVENFDAHFFKISPQEAAMLDPQVRLFIETTWQALEHAGYATEKYSGAIGVFAGMADSTYLRTNLLKNQRILDNYDYMQLHIATGGNFMATRTSYLLGLTGPSLNINTACSTSLVVIHEACRHLQSFECDLAVAGGVSVYFPQHRGYLYQPEGILSPDGHCRVFDSQAAGTVPSGGVGVVVLKRLQEALAEGDHIEGIILGTAINNDGSTKVGFSAPSVQGQALCIQEALEISDVQPEQVSYIETHGTGTLLGDPIEIAALAKVFTKQGPEPYCALGSVKANIGHTDCAAGVAGFIKTICALKHKLLPATLHFQQANPRLNLANTPFYVNQHLKEWKCNGGKRIAGVSAFGIGGTNAHAVLQEAPLLPVSESPTRAQQLLLVSAKTATALEQQLLNLANSLVGQSFSPATFADVAYTLQVGRNDFKYRAALVADSATQAVQIIQQRSSGLHLHLDPIKQNNKIVFVYPGQGMQYAGMAESLYMSEPVYQQAVDECCRILQVQLNFDIKPILLPKLYATEACQNTINQTQYAQPALFITSYALTRLLNFWGIKPDAMLGHSLGEYMAAYFSGLFSLEDALKIVVLRGQLMAKAEAGSMLAVMLPKQELLSLIAATGVELAADNGPSLCVVTGQLAAIEDFEKKIASLYPDKPLCRRLHTSHAFHSSLMEPILAEFEQVLQQVVFHRPHSKFMSNLTGDWVLEEAMSPGYWLAQLRHTVQFNQGIQHLLAQQFNIFVEVGPGNGLSRLIQQQVVDNRLVIHTLAHAQEAITTSDVQSLLQAVAKLWLQDISINWQNFYKDQKRRRVALPTYPFERRRHWIEPDATALASTTRSTQAKFQPGLYQPAWLRAEPVAESARFSLAANTDIAWLILSDDKGLGDAICAHLVGQNQKILQLKANFEPEGKEEPQNFEALSKSYYLEHVAKLNVKQLKIIYLGGLEVEEGTLSASERSLDLNFYSLTYLAQACIEHPRIESVELVAVCSGLYKVLGDETISPIQALLLGPCIVLPQEDSRFKTKLIDIGFQTGTLQQFAHSILLEFNHFPEVFQPVAYRNHYRWVTSYNKAIVNEQASFNFKKQGVYLITGGLGGMGLSFAQFLAKHYQAKLVLLSRSSIPPEEEWESYLQAESAEPSLQAKIKALQELKGLGQQILIRQVDVADEQAINYIVQETIQVFGAIHGVIHAAGVAGGEVLLRTSKDSANKVLYPKVHGTIALFKALADKPLDCLILCSSLSAYLGRSGQLSYCAANNFLNSMAEAGELKAVKKIVAISWNRWLEVGMAAQSLGPILQPVDEILAKDAIMPKQAQQVLLNALHGSAARVLVSNYDWPNYFVEVAKDLLAKQHSLVEQPIASIQPSQAATQSITDRLLAIFQQILGVPAVSTHDDFFELGGHSLLALQLLEAINKQFSVKVVLDMLYRLRTVSSLAKFIAAPDITQNANSSLVTLKADGTKLPVFFIHPIGGTAFCYLPLVREMALDRPCYALQDPGIKQQMDFNHLEEVIDYYLAQIKTIQPTGPYVFIGASYGGTVAYEMAQRLSQQAEVVQLVCMLDSWASFSSHFQDQDFFNKAMRLKHERSSKQLGQPLPLPDEAWRTLQWQRMQLLLNFEPSISKGQVLLIKAAELLEEYQLVDEPANHWRHYAQALIVEKAPGDHETMLSEQNVLQLSKIIKPYLENAP